MPILQESVNEREQKSTKGETNIVLYRLETDLANLHFSFDDNQPFVLVNSYPFAESPRKEAT
jgi:hypothetical protein